MDKIKSLPKSVLTAIIFLVIMLTVFTIVSPGVMIPLAIGLAVFAAFIRVLYYVIEKK